MIERAWIVEMGQPRGPVYDAVVRANFQLGHRVARASGTKISDMDGILARELANQLGGLGVPSERTVRQWERERPDFPEEMIETGIVGGHRIVPLLRNHLGLGDFRAPLQQGYGAWVSPVHSYSPGAVQIAQEGSPESWLEGLATLLLVVGGIWLLASVIQNSQGTTPQSQTSAAGYARRQPLLRARRYGYPYNHRLYG